MKFLAILFFSAVLAACSRNPAAADSAASSPEASAPATAAGPNETAVPRELREGYTHLLRLLAAQQIHSFPYHVAQYRAEQATQMLPDRDKASVAELITTLRTASGFCQTRSQNHTIPSSVEQFVEGAGCRYSMETLWFEDPARQSQYEWKSDDQTVVALAGITRVKSTFTERRYNGERAGYLRTETGRMTFSDGTESAFYFEFAAFNQTGESLRTVTLIVNMGGSEVEIRLGYEGGPTVNRIPADRVAPLW